MPHHPTIIENTPEIETDRLILRKFTADDAPDLLTLLKDREVNTFLPWFPVDTPGQALAFLRERFLEHYKTPTAYRYAVCLKPDRRPIGYVTVGGAPSFDFGYALRKEFWGLRITTEAAAAVSLRLRSAGFEFITATHDVKNPASGEVMKKIGMEYRYSYVEQWQPKNIPVTFRMYQLNFTGSHGTFMGYWDQYPEHFIESGV